MYRENAFPRYKQLYKALALEMAVLHEKSSTLSPPVQPELMPMHTAYVGPLENARRLADTLQPAGYQVVAFDPAALSITTLTEGPLTIVPRLQDLAENVPLSARYCSICPRLRLSMRRWKSSNFVLR